MQSKHAACPAKGSRVDLGCFKTLGPRFPRMWTACGPPALAQLGVSDHPQDPLRKVLQPSPLSLLGLLSLLEAQTCLSLPSSYFSHQKLLEESRRGRWEERSSWKGSCPRARRQLGLCRRGRGGAGTRAHASQRRRLWVLGPGQCDTRIPLLCHRPRLLLGGLGTG